MRELFQEMGARLDVYDHTTFERAVLALIEKEGTYRTKKDLRRHRQMTLREGSEPGTTKRR